MLRTLRGYSTVFNQLGRCGEVFESIAPQAFDLMLSAERKITVTVNAFEHFSAPLARTADLFVDGYGLGFQALVDCSGKNFSLVRSVATGMDRASVGLKIIESQWTEFCGQPHRVVTRATIDEITLCSDPVYEGTRTWWADCQGELPAKFSEWDRRWCVGHVAYTQRTERAALAKRNVAASIVPLRCPPTAQTYSALRDAAVAQVSRTGVSILINHVAFSKYGKGFA